jgi:hypothetical protein
VLFAAALAQKSITHTCSTLAGLGLATSLLSWLVVEPLATDLMLRRYELENASGPRDEGALRLVAVVVVVGIVELWHLGRWTRVRGALLHCWASHSPFHPWHLHLTSWSKSGI